MRRLFQYLDYFGRGLLMGAADIIPGVSGGTVALIVAVYERLVASISELFSFVISLLRVDVQAARTHWWATEWRLILPLGVGIVGAFVTGARFIPGLLEAYPMHMYALFFGLVAASLAIPWLRIEERHYVHVMLAGAAALLAFFLVGLPQLQTDDPGLLRVFVSTSIAICAMILPGVSGAFLLEVMGIYAPTLEAINGLDLAYLATFALGAGIGIGLFAKLLSLLLERFHDITMAVLVGLIAGALRALWPYGGPAGVLRLPTDHEPVVSVALIGLAGFLLVAGLTFWGWRQRRDALAAP